jgi:hypothetical protein
MKERQNRGEYKNIKNFKIYLEQYEIAEASDAASFIQFPSLTIPCINVNLMHQLKKKREPNHIPMIKVNILLVDDAVQVKVLL